jgi:hypothetical protein
VSVGLSTQKHVQYTDKVVGEIQPETNVNEENRRAHGLKFTVFPISVFQIIAGTVPTIFTLASTVISVHFLSGFLF